MYDVHMNVCRYMTELIQASCRMKWMKWADELSRRNVLYIYSNMKHF